MRCLLLGVGAMASPRYRPAGLLVVVGRTRVMLDGGPGAVPTGPIRDWLVTDERAELARDIRALAAPLGCEPHVRAIETADLRVEPLPVRHTSHPTFGYRITASSGEVMAWAPEFLAFPEWAAGVDLLFADAAGWSRPIRFAHGAGSHAAALDVSAAALAHGVRRLVFAHIGRPTIRAVDAGARPPFGDFGVEGRTYIVRRRRRGEPGAAPAGADAGEPSG